MLALVTDFMRWAELNGYTSRMSTALKTAAKSLFPGALFKRNVFFCWKVVLTS
jgi:hypothetical protein